MSDKPQMEIKPGNKVEDRRRETIKTTEEV